MNILLDIRLLGQGGNSGIKEYTRLLTEEITRTDPKNRYLLLYSGIRKEPLPEAWRERKNVSVIDWRIPNKLLDASARTVGMPQIDVQTKADVVYSPNLNILRTARAPRIMTFHDLSFQHYPRFFSLRQRLWHGMQDWKKEAGRAVHLVADSAFTKSDLVAEGFGEEKISVIYPGIHPSFRPLRKESAARTEFRARRNLHRPFLLFIGTLEPRKNISAAIRAFSLLKTKTAFKDLLFVIAGSPGWLYREIMREAAASRASADIVFLGGVEDSERILLYNEAQGFVYPSFFEGFGFPPLEAQACGCPAVVSNRTSLPEIMSDSAAMVSPWNIAELAESLEVVLTEGQKRDELIKKGYENAARFRWEQTASHLLSLFTRFSHAAKRDI